MKFDINVKVEFSGELVVNGNHDARMKVRELNRRIESLVQTYLADAEVFAEYTIKEEPRLEYKECGSCHHSSYHY